MYSSLPLVYLFAWFILIPFIGYLLGRSLQRPILGLISAFLLSCIVSTALIHAARLGFLSGSFYAFGPVVTFHIFGPIVTLGLVVVIWKIFFTLKRSALISCLNPNCNAKIHSQVNQCPQCGTTTLLGQKRQELLDTTSPCKTCGCQLRVVDHIHVSLVSGSYIDQGSTRWMTSKIIGYDHPCEKCGDRKPLRYFSVAGGLNLAACAMVLGLINGLVAIEDWNSSLKGYGLGLEFDKASIWFGILSIFVFGYLKFRKARLLRPAEKFLA